MRSVLPVGKWVSGMLWVYCTCEDEERCVQKEFLIRKGAYSNHVVVNKIMALNQVANVKSLFTFFELCGKLKHLKRTGWLLKDIKEPESVAGHMYRMAMMAFLFGGDPSINGERCIKIALVHDLAECIVGDITPHDGISNEEKHRKENEAMQTIKSLLPTEVGEEIYQLWQEYEERKSSEAIVVKDLDTFDMIFQAFEYEKAGDRSKTLQEFFDSTEGKIQHPVVKKWAEELVASRNEASDSV